jgi:hypothetical protein
MLFLERQRWILWWLVIGLLIACILLLIIGFSGALASETRDTLDYLKFTVTVCALFVSIYGNYVFYENLSYMRSAIGIGLWYGYSRNFLDKVVESFLHNGKKSPIFVLASPSYSVIGTLHFVEFLEKYLPGALKAKGYTMESLYGSSSPGFYRQAYHLTKDHQHGGAFLNRDVFFDFPTTLISFEGAVDAIVKKNRGKLDGNEKSKEFEEMKRCFFESGEKWAKYKGTRIIAIDMPNDDVASFAKALVRELEDVADDIGPYVKGSV